MDHKLFRSLSLLVEKVKRPIRGPHAVVLLVGPIFQLDHGLVRENSILLQVYQDLLVVCQKLFHEHQALFSMDAAIGRALIFVQ